MFCNETACKIPDNVNPMISNTHTPSNQCKIPDSNDPYPILHLQLQRSASIHPHDLIASVIEGVMRYSKYAC